MQIFIAPVSIGGLIALLVYMGSVKLFWLAIAILIISVIVGVIYAERVRRKHGASRYASKIIGTPDIWPDEIETKKGDQEKSK